MNEREIYEAAAKAFKRIFDAGVVAGKFAEKSGLEESLKSTRKLAGEFEKLVPEEGKGVFNLLMCYAYKPFMKQPGVARICKEQAEYFLKRAESYGIEIPGKKQLPEIKKLPSE